MPYLRPLIPTVPGATLSGVTAAIPIFGTLAGQTTGTSGVAFNYAPYLERISNALENLCETTYILGGIFTPVQLIPQLAVMTGTIKGSVITDIKSAVPAIPPLGETSLMTPGMVLTNLPTLSFGIVTATSGSGDGSKVTITFPSQSTVPFPAGSTVVLAGFVPSDYNGSYNVASTPAPTTSTVSYTSAVNTTITTFGTITAVSGSGNPIVGGPLGGLTKVATINSATSITVSSQYPCIDGPVRFMAGGYGLLTCTPSIPIAQADIRPGMLLSGQGIMPGTFIVDYVAPGVGGAFYVSIPQLGLVSMIAASGGFSAMAHSMSTLEADVSAIANMAGNTAIHTVDPYNLVDKATQYAAYSGQGDTLDALITKLNSLPPELATLKDILKSVTKLP